MTASIRPRRSALYVPASNARALEKSKQLEADVLIFDLEDSVAPQDKDAGREALRHRFTFGPGAEEWVLRVNSLSSPWGARDLELAARAPVSAVLLPKVDGPEDVARAEAVLQAAGRVPSIWCMIETPRGVLAAEHIAAASKKIGALVMGTSDLAKDLRAAEMPNREPLLYALSRTVLAARAYNLDVLDGVQLDLDDLDAFDRSCKQGRALGFDGKTLIHPKTIATANRIFSPSAEQLEEARRIIDAFTAAKSGVAVLDGRLIERLHVDAAERLLELSEAIEARRSARVELPV